MHLAFSDWVIILLYFVASAAIGLAYTRKASQSLADYFVSGRSLPWWLAGTSMVATTFAADTPLVVAGLVAKYGVAGNWLWWNGAFSGVLTVFFFSRLWRRAGVLTDVEFAELRYGGRPAAVLRGFRALYLALPINLIIMGWVTRAMVTILQISLNIDPWKAAIFLFGVTALYSVFAGLWGVIVTDLFQFVFAMGGVDPAGRAGGAVGRRARCADRQGRGALRLDPGRVRRHPADGCGLAADHHAARLAQRAVVGRVVPRRRSPAAAGTWCSGSCPPRTSATACWRRSGSPSRTTRSGRGPGSWSGFVGLMRYPGLPNPEEGYVRVMVDILPVAATRARSSPPSPPRT